MERGLNGHDEEPTEEAIMLWNRDIHTELVSFLAPLAQQDHAEVPLSDGDVLLDHNVRLLPLHERHIASSVFEDWYMGCCAGSWVGDIGVRAVFMAELPLAGS